MTKQSFLAKLNSLSGNELYYFIVQFGKKKSDIDQYLKEYDPEKHDIFDQTKRPDKWVQKPIPGAALNEDGTQKMQGFLQPVSRIAVDAQQDITKTASGILCANKIELRNDTGAVEDVWTKNKLDLKTISACNYWLSETEVADLWYIKDKKLKVLILANSEGDTLYPVFDDLGDMICFARSYKSNEVVENDIETLTHTYLEIYLDLTVIKGDDNATGAWVFDKPAPHGFKQIPVSYCTIKRPIYWNVRSAISRFETSVSNLCDTNDYFGSPTAVVKGKIISYADKGESGKILQIDPTDPNAKIEYLTWNQAPESLKLEWEKLQEIITNSTRTINLSLQNLKGLFGSAPSAYAIKLLFTPAHMQAAEHEEIFGEYIQRRINIISEWAGISDVSPQFTYYLPKNEKEETENIVSAVTNGILSVESAVEADVLELNSDDELERITAAAPQPAPIEEKK